jgi:amino acid adenylation domain-containing protein
MTGASKPEFNLSATKRVLLESLLQADGLARPPGQTIPRRSSSEAIPLSFAQQRLWFFHRLQPDNIAYNLASAIRLTGSLLVEVLEQTLNEIVRRHEVLRTSFAVVDSQTVQVIASDQAVKLQVVDIRHISTAKRMARAQELAVKEVQRPFDLAQAPLLRALLLRLGQADYILLLTMHHIVSDGWSRGVLYSELSVLYEAFAKGEPSPLADLPVQYADFAIWQRNWMQGQVLEQHLAFWKRHLDEAPRALVLPTDRRRPALQGYYGANLLRLLPDSVTKRLRILARQEEVTLFMILLTAFNALLFRYTGQQELVVGSPIANRNYPETEGLIGSFVNMLALRSDVSGNPTARELLQRVREVCLDAYTHQDLPFERLVEALQPDRDLSRHPLFQVTIALHNAPKQNLALSGLTIQPVTLDKGTVRFDLEFHFWEEPDHLKLLIEYNTDLFDAATITRMADHFETLLAGIVADPDRPLSELPLLTEAERQQLLVAWNDTRSDYTGESCVHQLFEDRAKRSPDAPALIDQDRRLTYGQLNRQANQLAHYLQSLGVGPEVPVGICVERSLELVVALLGVLKAGGAYLPLDPAYPKRRLSHMLSDTRVPILLTQHHLAEKLPNYSGHLIDLDKDWPQISQQSQRQVLSSVNTSNRAYVIYTSGSTGRPKGVQIEHGNLLNLVLWHRTEFKVSAADRASQLARFGFDASVWELWPYLTAGASVLIADDETRLSPRRLRDWLVSQRITVSFVPTPLAEQLLVLKWPTDVMLRTLLTGGDKLQRYPPTGLPFELVNNYGPTENTVVATSGKIAPREDTNHAPPIGRPIANVQVYILDKSLQPVPVGVPGELYIGGSSLARGYLDRSKLAADRFIKNPFIKTVGARLYKTGDLVRYLPDGNIEFLGRIDHQVNIRGFRVELGEIETALGWHPAVRKNVVIDLADRTGHKRLVAYVIPSGEPAPTTTELRKFLQQRLPGYMVPATFVIMASLPLTPNGKVDRLALPAPTQSRSDLEEIPFVAPRTQFEEQIAGIFSDVLELDRIGINDNFFELGGHSLLAMQVFTQLLDSFQLELPLRKLFESPTVAGLAEHLEAIRKTMRKLRDSPLASSDDREEIEL